MFTSSQGHLVVRTIVPYARLIADVDGEEVPQFNWASTVLAATYQALYDACTKKEPLATFARCPLLLQLWSYEWFAIGWPVVDRSPYPEEWYGEPEEDAPTMASLWCRRRFDKLHPDDVVWQPYSFLAVQSRAGLGLLPLCTRDEEY
ncbi:uncharacterized protein LOC133909922 [Phragmites australis]|uniref:uncharacterized protein LOC133909922 n=1 Tax=Phragmites australis TaxID=29695 RepID=UPI002D78C421|nr:uncharacterized protein LOC133909922 [Phragmites australis]